MDLVTRQANWQGRDLQRKGKLNEPVAGAEGFRAFECRKGGNEGAKAETDGVLSRKKARREA
jgi:hypothetical protein